MLKKIKIRKVAVVVFLTLLIWVWADLALDTEKPFYNATISISRIANPNLWISFKERSFDRFINLHWTILLLQ